jgi:hypothetical protein
MGSTGLHHIPSNYSRRPSSSDGLSYLNSVHAIEEDRPLHAVHIMEQTTEVADTFHSQAGQQDLIDTDVFPKVSAANWFRWDIVLMFITLSF